MVEVIEYNDLPQEVQDFYGGTYERHILKIMKHKAVLKHAYFIIIRDGSQHIWEYLRTDITPRIGKVRKKGWNMSRIEPDRLKRR